MLENSIFNDVAENMAENFLTHTKKENYFFRNKRNINRLLHSIW